MRLVPLIGCALLLELGWIALWPVGTTLSHSERFTSALLQMHPLVRSASDWMLDASHAVVPSLSAMPLAAPLGASEYVAPATALAGVFLWLDAVYALGLVTISREAPRYAAGVVIAGACVFQATLLFLPGLLSQDVFSYIAYGRISALYGLNPYIWPPSVLQDPIVPWVAEVWRTYASPYGPVWVAVQWLVALVSAPLSISDQALVYRGLADSLLLVNLGLGFQLMGRLTRLSRSQRVAALAALAWNPLLVFEAAANAHNDVLMITFVMLGLLLLSGGRRGGLASGAFALGTLVKYLSGLGLAWLALASAARVSGWRLKTGRVALVGGVALAVTLVVSLPWLELPDSLDPLVNETAGVGFVNALPDALMMLLARSSGIPVDVARSVERWFVVGCFAAYLAWETRQVWRDPRRAAIATALARSCLVYVLLVSTSFQTWYLCLPISLVALLGCRDRLTRVTLAYAAMALPALYVSYYLRAGTPGWVWIADAACPLLVLLPDVATRRTRATVSSNERRLLVRSDLPVGMDHLTLATGGRPPARPAHHLARDESVGPE